MRKLPLAALLTLVLSAAAPTTTQQGQYDVTNGIYYDAAGVQHSLAGLFAALQALLGNNPTLSQAPQTAPAAPSAVAGNGQITLSATPVVANPAVTGYDIKCGTAAGAEAVTPVVINTALPYNLTVANGTTEYCQIAARNTVAAGPYSVEVSATPAAPSGPATNGTYAVIEGSSGYAATPHFAGQAISSKPFSAAVTIVPAAADLSGENHIISSNGYNESEWLFGLNGGKLFFAWFDTNSNPHIATSSVSAGLSAGTRATIEVDATPSTGATVFSLNGSQLGTTQTTTSGGGTTYTSPSAPIQLGFDAGQTGNHFQGAVVSASFSIAGTLVVNPIASATGYSDSTNHTWTLSGSAAAVPSGVPVTAPQSPVASAGSNYVSLSATPVSAFPAVTGYTITAGSSSGGESATPIATNVSLPYIDATAVNGTAKYYKIAAVNSAGTGPYSAEVTATPVAGAVAAAQPNFVVVNTPGQSFTDSLNNVYGINSSHQITVNGSVPTGFGVDNVNNGVQTIVQSPYGTGAFFNSTGGCNWCVLDFGSQFSTNSGLGGPNFQSGPNPIDPPQPGSTGALIGTAVPGAGNTKFNIYENDRPGFFEMGDQWLGKTWDGISVHSGQNSESGWLGFLSGAINNNNYHGVNSAGIQANHILSIPLLWSNASYNTSQYSDQLQAEGGGAFDGDLTSGFNTILSTLSTWGNQTDLYVRTGWEENECSPASGPWCVYYYGNAHFISAFDHFATVLRSVVSSWNSSHPSNQYNLHIVWCPSMTGDSMTLSYPGDAYVDVIGMDVYRDLVAADTDPEAAFQTTLNYPNNGYAAMGAFAKAHGKPMAFPEWGDDRDNDGIYIRDSIAWMNAAQATYGEPVLYLTFWDSNGDYAGEFDDGVYPESGAMIRHMVAPTLWPVEPIAAPTGLQVLPGNNSVSISAAAIPNVTPTPNTYYLYEGTGPGLESNTPAATASTPSFTYSLANGTQGCFQVAGGNANSIGFRTGETCVTPIAPYTGGNPSVYLQLPGSGNGSASSSTSALEQYVWLQNNPRNNAEIKVLLSQQTGYIAGFPQAVNFSINSSNQITTYIRDGFGEVATATCPTPITWPGNGGLVWLDVYYDAIGAANYCYQSPYNGPAAVPARNAMISLGSVTGQDKFSITDAVGGGEPFYVGASNSSGGSQSRGQIDDVWFYCDQALKAHANFDGQSAGATSFGDSQSNTFQINGSASMQ